MTDTDRAPRVDTASRIIKAPRERIYQAFLNPEALATWRPPQGMSCRFETFDPQVGGTYVMALSYLDAGDGTYGKTSENSDVVRGRFVDLVPGARIVEAVSFVSDDTAFAGEMIITTTLDAVPEGTKVTFACAQVPDGISPEDHQEGMASTLANLAAFMEEGSRSPN